MSDDMTAAACAAQLRKLAEDDRFAKRADDLESLATDVERADGDAWAGVDLFAAFPSDTGIASSHPNWVERLLGIASGAAVFAPVAWTWWSFRDASRAYRTMLSEGTEADGTSFLSLWATGFDGNLSGSHLLVPMAGRSLALIILAIALLVAHRITAELNVRREEERRQGVPPRAGQCSDPGPAHHEPAPRGPPKAHRRHHQVLHAGTPDGP